MPIGVKALIKERTPKARDRIMPFLKPSTNVPIIAGRCTIDREIAGVSGIKPIYGTNASTAIRAINRPSIAMSFVFDF